MAKLYYGVNKHTATIKLRKELRKRKFLKNALFVSVLINLIFLYMVITNV